MGAELGKLRTGSCQSRGPSRTEGWVASFRSEPYCVRPMFALAFNIPSGCQIFPLKCVIRG
ncbi:hypothetical protein M404DRAFT_914197 [Pisolithus tinctorius Marx 270]|uniref:Uncharacterized protein n=1 Tax=Pisolithus tinctorius Marx 270 TaxID=870435 RepID=A0A0C3JMX3_PISTI|nr:hypothetical protein M404DRAFT_914197 [Pisolithus tinctorius Marx 270]